MPKATRAPTPVPRKGTFPYISNIEINVLGSKALSREAAREAAEAAIHTAMRGRLLVIANSWMKRPHLRDFQKDFVQEAFLSATKAVRRYKSSKGNLLSFVQCCVRLDLRKLARKHLAKQGGSVPHAGMVDLQSPYYQAAKPLEAAFGRAAPAEQTVAVGVRSAWLTGPAAARHVLMNRLRRCTFFEKEVLLRSWGVPAKPASRNAHCRVAAERAAPEPMAAIARSLGVNFEEARAAREAALWKIGTDPEAEGAGE